MMKSDECVATSATRKRVTRQLNDQELDSIVIESTNTSSSHLQSSFGSSSSLSSTSASSGASSGSRELATERDARSPKTTRPMHEIKSIQVTQADCENLENQQPVPIKASASSLSIQKTSSTISSEGDEIELGIDHTHPHHHVPVRTSSSSIDEDVKPQLSQWQRLIQWIQKLRHTFGTSFLMLVIMVYAVQGFKSFTALAINYFFKDDLDLQPAESQALMTVMMFPWGIKPLYGIISDSLPIWGYHRKSYIILLAFIGGVSFLVLSIPSAVTSSLSAVIMLTLTSLSTAVIDVVIDAKVVEMSRLDPKNGANDLQTVSWVSMSAGGVIGSLLSGPATHLLGVRGVFFFASTGPLVILGFGLSMTEAKSLLNRRNFVVSAKKQMRQLKGAVTTDVIWKCALWVFMSGAIGPGYSQVSFYFSTDVLKFTPEFLGFVSALGYVFLLVGTLIYNTFFKSMPFRRIFFFAQISLAVVSLLDIILVTRTNLRMGIPDQVFVLGDAVISDVFSRLKTMPVLVLCAKLCPPGVEGTLFALLMSISNFAYSVSEFWGALICSWLGIGKDHYEMLWLAILMRSAFKIVPICFLFLIPVKDPQELLQHLSFEDPKEDEDEPPARKAPQDDDSDAKILAHKKELLQNRSRSQHLQQRRGSVEQSTVSTVELRQIRQHDVERELGDDDLEGQGTVRASHRAAAESPQLRLEPAVNVTV